MPAATIDEPRYDVLWPLSTKAVDVTHAAARMPDLNGKTIAELWDVAFRGEVIYPQIRDYIRRLYPGAKFVDYSHFENFYSTREKSILAALPGELRKHQCDAVIVGIGA
jgi:hypothetical protein